MFQNFAVPTRPDQGPPRLTALRAQIAAQALDGFLVPRADVHQGEYVAPCDDRLAWLTGFTGSAGFCAVLADRAGVFVDGRYRVQVRQQVAQPDFTPLDWPQTQLGDWLKASLPDGGTIGFDPWLFTAGEIEKQEKRLAGSGITLRPCENLIDRIWADRPPRPQGKITIHPLDNAGEPHAAKRQRLADGLRKAGQHEAVITLPDSLCWLLNIRGSDIARNPVVQGFAVLRADGRVTLFADPKQYGDIESHFGTEVSFLPYDAFSPALTTLTGPVRVDKSTAPLEVSLVLKAAGIEISYADDPCTLPKALKNSIEIAGARSAHLRDGAAMVEFLCWLDRTAPQGGLTEIHAAQKLESFRRATNALREISFDTISAAGPHAALPHYRVSEDSNREIKPGELYLVDSGGQYLDGTTDITRTVSVGAPNAEQIACYTRVLQGMIAISRLRWPRGLAGRDLDPIARYPLWLAGLDYDHGTGHGVGAYLSVHEGPQRISRLSDVALQPGMILSNEPGYYREGAFGIRIENLLVVCDAAPLEGADSRDMLTFETLTHVPIDTRLIDRALLSQGERDWLNAYHAKTLENLAPRVPPQVLPWLKLACAPI